MKKREIILISVVIILSIALIIMTLMYVNVRNDAKKNLEGILENANATYEANIKINELEKELEQYKNNTITNTVTNTLNTNTTVFSDPYIPEGMAVADPNDNSGIKASDLKFDRSPENVTIEILEDTITRKSAEILITENNENSYGWGKSFRLQRKINGSWEEVETIRDLAFTEIAFNLDENNQLKMKVNYGDYYGELENGIYRIVKPVYDNGYIDLYSNEFEIK